MDAPIKIHQRSYNVEAWADPGDMLRVRGQLTDTIMQGLGLADGTPLVIHDMWIELICDPMTFEVVDVRSDMEVHPYVTCPTIVAAYRQLIGESVARGYSRKVKELFGGAQGCTHLGALLIAMGPVVIQARWQFDNLHTDPLAEEQYTELDRERHMNLSAGSCHMWAGEGAQAVALRNHEIPAEPMWKDERRVELQARVDHSDAVVRVSTDGEE